MRLWTIHPMYLDAKGLVALWREALLAKKVLEGRTKGYTKHPELDRFRACRDPLAAINTYLLGVWEEADSRGYSFDKTKIGKTTTKAKIPATKEVVLWEFEHLKKKLGRRCVGKCEEISKLEKPELHPLFKLE